MTTEPHITASGDDKASGYYGVGATFTITLRFDERVTVPKDASLTLSNGGKATLASGSGTTALKFTYTVSAADSSVLGLTITSINGAIKDLSGNVYSLDSAGGAYTVSSTLGERIDTTAPAVTNLVPQIDPLSAGGKVIFGAAHGNRIIIGDNFAAKLNVTLAVSHGVLNINGTNSGVTVAYNADHTAVTLYGTGSNITSLLNNRLVYQTNGDAGAQDKLVVTATDSVGNTTVVDEVVNITCFYAGTLIRTPAGEIAVETLKPGDLVLTHDGREVPVCWLGRQTVSTIFGDKTRILPIRIKAGALGETVPARDLLVSPDHAMFIDGVLVHAGALVNGTSIVREADVPNVFTYYHVEVADHSLIFAEGAPAETFVDNVDRLHFDNWDEYEALYPEGKIVAELPYPRAKSRRQVPVAIRVALAARAEAIGAVIADAAVA
ncbi:Hint domain-containing protein [Rhodoblastus acidophilus]|uniref:Hint domain-containing protein n=1 Tax=Rhodoblastus acidophilus TaxID=1074 RepID=A0A212RU37_RHOAC|nr:Hint domain-containing protein [Rhodoblastus acidophilus]PPQ37348.1 hypothetical protein CKO16_14390 [Rhodoblastus acidophilus]RAI23134.1 hypothetical protein CH337_03665 [Rhodoblastus acidophilus]SNB76214.1 Hint domain-containing protein [Rhodoblastus acidophilus]